MASFMNTFRSRYGHHAPVRDYSQWANAPSGDGFNVSLCRHCHIEMTMIPGDQWRPISASDRL